MLINRRAILVILISLMVISAAGPEQIEENRRVLNFSNQFFTFEYFLDRGCWSLSDSDNQVVLKNASARALMTPSGAMTPRRVFTTLEADERTWESREIKDCFGQGVELAVSCLNPDKPAMITVFRFYPQKRFFLVKLILKDIPIELKSMKVKSLEPVSVTGPHGGLFLGPNPVEYLILENGSNLYLDFLTNLYQAGRSPPIPARFFSAESRSDFSSLIYDKHTSRSAMMGFLSGEDAGMIIFDLDCARSGNSSRKQCLSKYQAQWTYRPPLPASRDFESGDIYIDLFAETPFDALEDYGDALSTRLDIQPWPGDVPAGWNSWGEYYSDINEAIILENLEFAARHFMPFGMSYFQIDSGYSPYWGDWEADPKRFPHGMKWMADRIREHGMRPGIWISPFEADINSEIFQEHPDWFLPAGGLRQKLLIGEELRVLDLSRPEVKSHIRSLIRKYTKEWGYQWLKVDFAYHFLMHERAGDGSRTVPEYYYEGMKIIREEAGPDVFVLGVGVTGFNYGNVNGMRITLDNMPAWNNRRTMFSLNPFNKGFGFLQGIVPTVRNVSRKYWLNYRVWINHPDLIYFDNDRWPDWGPRPLTFNESLCFASVVGLVGGIVKIGDKMVDMTESQVEVIQKILPVCKAGARPVDLFEKETPEIWDLKIKTEFDKWDVVGVFNWGKNWTGGKELPEIRRAVNVELERLGLRPDTDYMVFEFWNEEYIGTVRGKIDIDLDPRTVKVLAVRELPYHPWFLSYNRHISQGAVDIESIEWDGSRKDLSGTQRTVPGFEYRLYFYSPDEYALGLAHANGGEIQAVQYGNIVRLSFIHDGTKIKWRVGFKEMLER